MYRLLALAAVALSLVAMPARAADPRHVSSYTARLIPPPPPWGYIFASSIDGQGRIAGDLAQFGDTSTAFATGADGDGIVLITPGCLYCSVGGMNDHGVVVGTMSDSGDEPITHAFVVQADGTGFQLLPTAGESEGSQAQSINLDGEIVGAALFQRGGSLHAAAWTPGTHELKDLDPDYPSGFPSLAWGVNAAGKIVGQDDSTSGERQQAFIQARGQSKMHKLGFLPGGSSAVAYAINQAGIVVGSGGVAPPSPATHAWVDLEDGRGLIDITPNAVQAAAVAINGVGHVVGYATADGFDHDRAFLYDVATSTLHTLDQLVQDLPLKVYLQSATAINDRDQIVASDGDGRLWLLTPAKK